MPRRSPETAAKVDPAAFAEGRDLEGGGPEAIALALRATGVTDEREIWNAWWQSGDPACQALAAEKGRRFLGLFPSSIAQVIRQFQWADQGLLDCIFSGREDLDCSEFACEDATDSAPDLSLYRIPDGLRVREMFFLANTQISQIPPGTRIDGSLVLMSNSKLREFPDWIRKVNGDLCLYDAEFKTLPDGLTVNGTLELKRSAIHCLPEGLKVGGWFDLEHCKDWDGVIPTDAEIGGMIFTDRFPAGDEEHGRGGISLSEWRKLEQAAPAVLDTTAMAMTLLATGASHAEIREAVLDEQYKRCAMDLGKSLLASGMLPGKAFHHVDKIWGCLPAWRVFREPGMPFHGDSVRIDGDLDLSEVEDLPHESLIVEGSLTLAGGHAHNLRLPRHLEVGGNFSLQYCKDLKELPENLSVGAMLNLGGCENLQELPGGLRVGGKLNLKGTGVRSIPQDAQIGGTIESEQAKLRQAFIAQVRGLSKASHDKIAWALMGGITLDEWRKAGLP